MNKSANFMEEVTIYFNQGKASEPKIINSTEDILECVKEPKISQKLINYQKGPAVCFAGETEERLEFPTMSAFKDFFSQLYFSEKVSISSLEKWEIIKRKHEKCIAKRHVTQELILKIADKCNLSLEQLKIVERDGPVGCEVTSPADLINLVRSNLDLRNEMIETVVNYEQLVYQDSQGSFMGEGLVSKLGEELDYEAVYQIIDSQQLIVSPLLKEDDLLIELALRKEHCEEPKTMDLVDYHMHYIETEEYNFGKVESVKGFDRVIPDVMPNYSYYIRLDSLSDKGGLTHLIEDYPIRFSSEAIMNSKSNNPFKKTDLSKRYDYFDKIIKLLQKKGYNFLMRKGHLIKKWEITSLLGFINNQEGASVTLAEKYKDYSEELLFDITMIDGKYVHEQLTYKQFLSSLIQLSATIIGVE